MIEVRIITEFPGDMLEHIAGFYISAQWITSEDDTSFLLPALSGSTLVAGAFDGNKIIGCGRAISDGCSDAYIQDVFVSPEYRGQGIGRELIKSLTDALQKLGVDWIALVGEPGTEKFYQRLGWKKKVGYTMWQWDNK